MTPIKTIVLTAAIISLSACSNREQAGMKDSAGTVGGATEFNISNEAERPEPLNETSAKTTDTVTERKLIKKGEISFETKSISSTKAFLQKTVNAYKGYISNEKIESYRTNPTEVLTIRIPSIHFDTLISKIGRRVGEFDSKKIDIDDVTAEFVDVEARLKNKKQLEEKYQELLKKAANMEDILKIEKEISSIREDIESTEGRLRYLSSQVGYSTLTVTYYEEKPASGFNFGGKIGEAFSSGGTGFLWFLIVMVQLWPLWLIGVVVWYLILKIVKRQKRKTRVQNSQQ